MSLIYCNDLTFKYDGHIALQNATFHVNEGDYLGIVGENGSGKSTLIKGILNLKAPSSGTISFGEGLSLNDVGYLPQQTAAQKDFPASVYEVVLSGKQNKKRFIPIYNSHDREEVDNNLKLLGISNLKHSCYRELSGGQQQRVLLARALCTAKKMILFDEPVSGLDPKITNEMYNLIQKLNKEEGITIIMVSHDVKSIVKYSTHILHLSGHGHFFGTTNEYKKSRLGFEFLGGEADV